MSRLYYQCNRGHIFERCFSLEEISNNEHKLPYRCHLKYSNRRCNTSATRIYISDFKAKLAMGFKPTLYFEDTNGSIAMPPTNELNDLPKKYLDDMKAKGFMPKTIQTFGEYEKMLRNYQRKINDDADARDEIRKMEWEQVRKHAEHEVYNGFTYPIFDENGNITGEGKVPPLNEMSPELRQHAEKCLEYMNRPLEQEDRHRHYIDAIENDNYTYKDRDEGSRWI